MKERPILFSAPMVRAILAGTKTQTRRALHPDLFISSSGAIVRMKAAAVAAVTGITEARCPYGQPGDRLWVREAFGVPPDCEVGYHKFTRLKLTPCAKERPTIHYRADDNARAWVERWRPGMFMPRWASRITLEVTGVRVERLQDISRADAIAEGVDWNKCPERQTQQSIDAQRAAHRMGLAAHYEAEIDYVGGYRWLWESINGPGSWDANTWVWCVEFRRT